MVHTALLRILRKAVHLSALDWRDLLVAIRELAIARLVLAQLSSHDIIANNLDIDRVTEANSGANAMPFIGRVSKAISTMAAYVPWRSDCLVQALAARRWLSRVGISSKISIGVRRDDVFLAHAWLCAGDVIVTGGDITPFVSMPLDSGPAHLTSLKKTMRWPR